MPLRVLLTLPTLCIAAALSTSSLCQTAPTHPADPSPPPPAAAKTAAPAHPSHVLFFYTSPRSTVEMEVHTIPPTNTARLDRLREQFESAGCDGSNMREQSIRDHGRDRRGDGGANLTCTWPGSSPGIIVLAAHYDHQGPGQGALDDWSGAALLPFLYQAIQGQPRDNTFVFLESWKRQGAEIWLKSLPREQRRNVRAMIDLDALGLSYTRFYTTFRPFENTPPSASHLQAELLWAALDEGLAQPPEQTPPRHWLSEDMTDPFRAYLIPTVVVHSVPAKADHLPGSAQDVASAIDGNAYYTSYRLICAFLASLDRVAAKLNRNDPIWSNGPPQLDPVVDTPRVTFRQFNKGHLAPPAH